jgi:hypothetical protein
MKELIIHFEIREGAMVTGIGHVALNVKDAVHKEL